MSYRYNTIDIIVGVGMCAILFGALFVFLAANGTYQAVLPHALALEQSAGMESGQRALQSAFGQAIVDQAISDRQADQALAHSVAEWNRAAMAQYDFQAGSNTWLATVLHEGVSVPAAQLARVQGVMGRAIVNFTKRGIRNGLLSADQYATMYNMRMIGAAEAQGQRLHENFMSTWQATLGRRIVEAAQHDWLQAGAIQERLGSTLVQVLHAQMSAENRRAVQQEQLASLIVAAVRSKAPTVLVTTTPSVSGVSEDVVIASAASASWPEVPMGYLMLSSLLLAILFLAGLSMAVQSREARALAQRRHDADRWAFRMAG